MNACGNVVALARELGVARRVLYNWRDRVDETNPPLSRTREVILRKRILKLKRLLANKTMEVDFLAFFLHMPVRQAPGSLAAGFRAAARAPS